MTLYNIAAAIFYHLKSQFRKENRAFPPLESHLQRVKSMLLLNRIIFPI